MKMLVRADASNQIGVGHVMRCLTLAQQLATAGAEVTFACRDLPGHLFFRVLAQGFSLIKLAGQYPGESASFSSLNWQTDFTELGKLLDSGMTYDCLIVDHYSLDWRWEQAMRQHVRYVMVIDDLCNRRHDADFLLDQSLSASAEAYQAWLEPYCQQLLGPKFALLRPEFAGEAIAIKAEVERILVNFGGADPTREMFKVMDALQGFAAYTVDFVAGASNPALPELAERVAAHPHWRLYAHVDDFAAVMRQADLFIGAAGGTSWERAALGLPSLCISVADNQRVNALSLAQRGAHHYLGESGNVSAEQIRQSVEAATLPVRQRWAQVSKQLADGYGTRRVAAHLLRSQLVIRPVVLADAKTLFDARNSPLIRQQSLQSDLLQWEAHCTWLEAKLASSDSLLLIGEALNHAVGVVRFDRIEADLAEISIYLVPGQLNLGWGRNLLVQSQIVLRRQWPQVRSVRAQIKEDNRASLALFTGAGYEKQELFYIRTLRELKS